MVADAQFVDPAHGDYRVKDDSPALTLGFVNFPVNQFGVQKPELRAIARMPQLPQPKTPTAENAELRREIDYLRQQRDILKKLWASSPNPRPAVSTD